MRRVAFSALASAILLVGINPVKADDWTIKSGATTTRDMSSGSDLWSNSGNTFTTNTDIDCNSATWYNNTDFLGPKAALCFQRIIDKHNKLGKAVQATAAMNTAMSTLPESSPDSKYTCGVGTGGNSGTFAVSTGCSSNLSDRLSFNAGGSIALEDSQNSGSGTIDNYGLKAGFLYKFGPIKKSTLISLKEKKELKAEVTSLKSTNEKLQELIAMQDKRLAMQNQRLESLERIALGETKSQEFASNF